MGRRTFLQLAVVGAAAPLAACGGEPERGEAATSSTAVRRRRPDRPRVLVAYFSRPGENYWNGGRRELKVGNTKRLVELIDDRIRCDVHEIRAADPYPRAYDPTVARNSREQDEDARPAIAGRLASIDGYDTVVLASPIWNVRPPMIMATFAEQYDFRGVTVLPVTTHAMSGLGRAADDYARYCRGATVGRGLAVRGEEVRDAAGAVDAWVRRLGLPRRG